MQCNTMQYHAISCNTMQYHAIKCNTMQYYAIQCNTMQYHASLITADWAYHWPVGSIMAIFSQSAGLPNWNQSIEFCVLHSLSLQKRKYRIIFHSIRLLTELSPPLVTMRYLVGRLQLDIFTHHIGNRCPPGTTPTSPSMEWPLFTLVSLKSCFPPYIVGLLPTVFNYWQIFHFVIYLQFLKKKLFHHPRPWSEFPLVRVLTDWALPSSHSKQRPLLPQPPLY